MQKAQQDDDDNKANDKMDDVRKGELTTESSAGATCGAWCMRILALTRGERAIYTSRGGRGGSDVEEPCLECLQ